MKSEKNSCLLKFHSSMILPCQLTTPSQGSLAILDDLDIEGVDFPLSANFNFDEEPASGYIGLEAYDVQSTNDYLESLKNDDVTAYGMVYFDF